MKLKTCMLSICIAALPFLALAQGSVDGKWAGEVPGGRGPQQVTLTLKADGGKLTGSVAGGRGGEITLDWSGALKGDEIAFTRMAEGGQGQPQEFTLKRQQ
jgi:hypothetical protein